MLIVWLLAGFGVYVIYQRAKDGINKIGPINRFQPSGLPILEVEETKHVLPRRDTKAMFETPYTAKEILAMQKLKAEDEYPLDENVDPNAHTMWGNWANRPAVNISIDGLQQPWKN